MKPFVKWAGGKKQLLEVLLSLMPKKYNIYHEPFIGGGALFFEVAPKKATINDFNIELMATYRTIRDNPKELMKYLKNLVETHNNQSNPHDFYYKIRDLAVSSDLDIAVRFIYLNKVGYNGLYRVNMKGEFNVPYGKKDTIKNSTLFETANINNISKYLKENEIEITSSDFEYVRKTVNENDFVFIDSPYDNGFVSYTKQGFNEDDHRRLAKLVKELDDKNVKFMLTNHNTPLIQELYKDFNIIELTVNRSINSDGKNRANATTEVIILNYPLTRSQEQELEYLRFFKGLKTTSFVLKDYVNWEKIKKHLYDYRFEINDLNILFTEDVEEFDSTVDALYERNSNSFKILPLLVSVRDDKFTYLLGQETKEFDTHDKDIIKEFLIQSGLRDNLFLSKSSSRNLKEYLMGLEVGLTNADKKNLSGKWANEQIGLILNKYGIDFDKEVPYSKVLDTELKRNKKFDYVFKYDEITYCLEVNFYNKSGSKINSESARFEELNMTFNNYKNIEFIWVTDGNGLLSHKSQITKALKSIEHLYNFETFEKFLLSITNPHGKKS